VADEQIIPGRSSKSDRWQSSPAGAWRTPVVICTRLGLPSSWFADIGDDELGSSLVHVLSESGLDCKGIRRVCGAATSYSLVFEPPGRDRAFWHHVGANASFDGARVRPEKAGPGPSGLFRRFSRRCTQSGVRSCDRCWRGFVRPARRRRFDLSTVANGFPCGSCRLEGALDADGAARGRTVTERRRRGQRAPNRQNPLRLLRHGSSGGRLLGLGAAVVLLTDGARGMNLITANADRLGHSGRCFAERAGEWADREFFLPASKSRHVVTTGAGDAATAGLLYGVLSAASAGKAASLAAELAAFKVDGAGGQHSLSRTGPARRSVPHLLARWLPCRLSPQRSASGYRFMSMNPHAPKPDDAVGATALAANPYGYYDPSTREYVITRPDTPAPWIKLPGTGTLPAAFISNTAGGVLL